MEENEKTWIDDLKEEIDTNIKPNNHKREITGAKLNTTLKEMVDELSEHTPKSLSELEGDTTHRTVTDEEKQTWGKSAAIFDEQQQYTDAQRLQALANVSNQEAGYDSSEPPVFTGKMGYVVLQPETDDKTTFAAQIANKPNTIFEIRDVFDLDKNMTTIEQVIAVNETILIGDYWYYYNSTPIHIEPSKSQTGKMALAKYNNNSCLLSSDKSSPILVNTEIQNDGNVYPAIMESAKNKYSVSYPSDIQDDTHTNIPSTDIVLTEKITLDGTDYFLYNSPITVNNGGTITALGCFICNEDKTSVLGEHSYKNEGDSGIVVYIVRKNTEYEARTFKVEPFYEIEDNCTLKFNGGKIKNSLIKCNNTVFDGETNADIDISGSISNEIVYATWFGCDKTGISDCTNRINNLLSVCNKICFDNDSRFKITNTITIGKANIPQSVIIGNNTSIVKDSNGANSNPAFHLYESYSSLSGAGRLNSSIIDKDGTAPRGIVLIGFASDNDVTQKNILQCNLSNLRISGNLGGTAQQNAVDDMICLAFISPFTTAYAASYFNIVQNVALEYAHAGILLYGDTNANQISNIFFNQINVGNYRYCGALWSKNLIFNGKRRFPMENAISFCFVHTSTDCVCIRIIGRFLYNQITSFIAEPGGSSKFLIMKEEGGADVTTTPGLAPQGNTIIGIDNTAGASTISDTAIKQNILILRSSATIRGITAQNLLVNNKITAKTLELTDGFTDINTNYLHNGLFIINKSVNYKSLSCNTYYKVASLSLTQANSKKIIVRMTVSMSGSTNGMLPSTTSGYYATFMISRDWNSSNEIQYSYKLIDHRGTSCVLPTIVSGEIIFLIRCGTVASTAYNKVDTTVLFEVVSGYEKDLTLLETPEIYTGEVFRVPTKYGEMYNFDYTTLGSYNYVFTEGDLNFDSVLKKPIMFKDNTWVNLDGTPLANYTITKSSIDSNITIDNSATSIEANKTYVAALTANSGYSIDSVTVTMGGVDVTSFVYNSSTGVIYIASVTGNIVITATATQNP